MFLGRNIIQDLLQNTLQNGPILPYTDGINGRSFRDLALCLDIGDELIFNDVPCPGPIADIGIYLTLG